MNTCHSNNLLCLELDDCPRKDKGYFEISGPFAETERVVDLSHTRLHDTVIQQNFWKPQVLEHELFVFIDVIDK
jgi:hypothetical protein